MRSIRTPLVLLTLLLTQQAFADGRVVSSLGRLEPENGVLQLAGPSGGGLTGAVMTSLSVAEGDWVESGQVVARLDDATQQAQLAVAQAQAEALERRVTGKAVTPVLLSRIFELTQGRSLEANISLVLNNARLGAEIACEIGAAMPG